MELISLRYLYAAAQNRTLIEQMHRWHCFYMNNVFVYQSDKEVTGKNFAFLFCEFILFQ